jgi:uncharacterized membrane protein
MSRLAETVGRVRERVFDTEHRAEILLNVVLAAGLLLAAGSVGWAVAVSDSGGTYTELSLLTENETGAVVADDYPTEMVRGEATPLVVAIGNHERRALNYTVVVELQRVVRTNDTTAVSAERELRRFTARVAANETRQERLSLAPSLTGSRLRLAVLLYKGPVPADPSVQTADHEVHLWVDVPPG